ncbi:MAG: hypothetical protein IPN88_16835 [Bacteroidetes bacterium]|nr:hypothetical protein [Bacteroidota bacterium]
MKIYILHLTLAAFLLSSPLIAQNNSSDDSKKNESESDKKDPWKTETFKGLNFRCLGTAKTSGRVIDLP